MSLQAPELDEGSGTERPLPRALKRVLVTGCAGFLGSTLSEALIARGCEVVGVDCFTDYYPRKLKEANLASLRDERSFEFLEVDLSCDPLTGITEGIDCVFHLAAQPGVSQSFGKKFVDYVSSNVLATQALLEEAKRFSLGSFVYASSSSVYGDAPVYPTHEGAPFRPVSPYGMTKVATEELAGVYERCFGIPSIGLRYFTAYGPRQRPDMAFTRMMTAAVNRRPLALYGDGRQVRDFTFVADVVDGTIRAAAVGRPGAVYNIGGGHPVELCDALRMIEQLVGYPLRVVRRPPRTGDARATGCDPTLARVDLGYVAQTDLFDGLRRQLDWILGRRRAEKRALMAR